MCVSIFRCLLRTLCYCCCCCFILPILLLLISLVYWLRHVSYSICPTPSQCASTLSSHLLDTHSVTSDGLRASFSLLPFHIELHSDTLTTTPEFGVSPGSPPSQDGSSSFTSYLVPTGGPLPDHFHATAAHFKTTGLLSGTGGAQGLTLHLKSPQDPSLHATLTLGKVSFAYSLGFKFTLGVYAGSTSVELVRPSQGNLHCAIEEGKALASNTLNPPLTFTLSAASLHCTSPILEVSLAALELSPDQELSAKKAVIKGSSDGKVFEFSPLGPSNVHDFWRTLSLYETLPDMKEWDSSYRGPQAIDNDERGGEF